MASVSAGDIDNTTDSLAVDDTADVDVVAIENDTPNDAYLGDDESDEGNVIGSGDVLENNTNKIISASAKTSSADVYVINSKFSIQILDDNGKGIPGKKVTVKFNNNASALYTNDKGYVYFNLTEKGTYKLSYTFKHKGYTKVTGSKSITIVGNTKSKISGSNYVAYVGDANPYTVTLTTGGVSMPNKNVVVKIKGKTYTAKTDSNGKAVLNINLAKGTYKITYTFKGVTNAKSASGYSKITVKKGMPTKIVRMNSITYRHLTPAPIIFKYKDVRGKAIPYKTIVFKMGSKTLIKKTDKEGLVSFTINRGKGTYKTYVNSYNTDVYKKSTISFTLKVKSSGLKYNGFWLFGADMKKVNLKDMAKKGVNQIFLNYYAVTLHGKSNVSAFATEAKSLGINVHI